MNPMQPPQNQAAAAPSSFLHLMAGTEVSLAQILQARETRALRQQDLIHRYQKPLLCFTMNIAGPVKNNPLIQRAFAIGIEQLHQQLFRTNTPLLFEHIFQEVTGNEAYFVADTDPLSFKEIACELEEQEALGRLYDLDVLYPDPLPPIQDASAQDSHSLSYRKVERQEVGRASRSCLICGKSGRGCASRRTHTITALQETTASLLYHGVLTQNAFCIAEAASRALLYEVSVTPKPGLVDRSNNGSHRDMDFYTFLDSISALWPYFLQCAKIGQEHAKQTPKEVFSKLRPIGKQAEGRMLQATGGVNTHKGAIFSLGLVCAAAGRLSADFSEANAECTAPDLCSLPLSSASILKECEKMTATLVEEELSNLTRETARTTGQRLYAEYKITGIRGQMQAGLPSVSQYGLPLLKQLLAKGKSKDEAGAAVLLSLIAHTTDTNLIHRSNLETQQKTAKQAEALLHAANGSCPDTALLQELDQSYIAQNLSPGGCADLLAICWFLYFLEQTKHPNQSERKMAAPPQE